MLETGLAHGATRHSGMQRFWKMPKPSRQPLPNLGLQVLGTCLAGGGLEEQLSEKETGTWGSPRTQSATGPLGSPHYWSWSGRWSPPQSPDVLGMGSGPQPCAGASSGAGHMQPYSVSSASLAPSWLWASWECSPPFPALRASLRTYWCACYSSCAAQRGSYSAHPWPPQTPSCPGRPGP